MVDEESICEIVATYELPQKLEDRLTFIATEQLRARYVNCFDQQYEYIAFLVDRFTRSSLDRRTRSLDEPAKVGNMRTLHETLPSQEMPADTTNPRDQHSPESTDRAMEILRPELDAPHYTFVEELLQTSHPVYHPKPCQVQGKLAKIQSRLTEIAQKYQVNGRIVFPKRPIQDVRFHPLRIRFGRRLLGENPLQFFRQHAHVYRGLRRGELFEIDQGLYQALRAKDQLHLAIPEKYKRS